MGGANTGRVFVALADQGSRGVVFVLSATTGAHLGRIEIAGTPEAVLNGAGGELLVLCGNELVSYDLATLQERWRTDAE